LSYLSGILRWTRYNSYSPLVTLTAQERLAMALMSIGSRTYDNIRARDNSRIHLGDVYNDYRSPEERALKAILESLSYPGMTDHRDALAEAHERTFDWTFLKGETAFLVERDQPLGTPDSIHQFAVP
jgi:hypothetical protein